MKGEAPLPGGWVLLGNADSSVEAECELRRREVERYEAEGPTRRDSAQSERLIFGFDPSNFAKSLPENALPILICIRDGIFTVGGVKPMDSADRGSTP